MSDHLPMWVELPSIDNWLRLTYGCGIEEVEMSRPATRLADIVDVPDDSELEPREAAARLVAAHQHESGWLDQFAQYFDRHRAGQSLARILRIWDLSQSHAARQFGVSRQALHKWLESGVPAERTEAVADLAAATDLLVHYLKRDRIPAVVRRRIAALEGRSLLELLGAGESHLLLQTCRDMFNFDRAQR